jgi:hypothetical protein
MYLDTLFASPVRNVGCLSVSKDIVFFYLVSGTSRSYVVVLTTLLSKHKVVRPVSHTPQKPRWPFLILHFVSNLLVGKST